MRASEYDEIRHSGETERQQQREDARFKRETYTDQPAGPRSLPEFHYNPSPPTIPVPPPLSEAEQAAAHAMAKRGGLAQISVGRPKPNATRAEILTHQLCELDRIMEQLVAEHGNGEVIDATWAASKRLFSPGATRR